MFKRFVQDDDGNWYLIPNTDHAVFLDCLEYYCDGVVTKEDWDVRWSDYECSHPTCYEVIVKEEG